MIFTSNFDDDWRPYVDTFMEASTKGLRAFWKDTPGFADPDEMGYDEFFQFVHDHVVEHDHYYAAYPAVDTTDVKAALSVDRALRSHEVSHPAGSADPAAWRGSLRRIEQTQQRFLGTIAKHWNWMNQDPAAAIPGDWPYEYAPGGGRYVELTSLAPFPRSKIDDVRRAIADELGRASRSGPATGLSPSLFARVPGVHYGRLAVLEDIYAPASGLALGSQSRRVKLRPRPNSPEARHQLKSAYLLLSVDADGSGAGQRELLASLHRSWTQPVIDRIWGSCYGFGLGRDRSTFVNYIDETSFSPTVGFADYPRASLWDVHRALVTHRAFSEFVFKHDLKNDPAAKLQGQYNLEVVPHLKRWPLDPPANRLEAYRNV